MQLPTRTTALPLTLIALLLTVACSDGMLNPDHGNVRVVLSASDESSLNATAQNDDDDDNEGSRDGTLSKLESASITFSSLLARNLDGELIDIGIDLPETIDVVSLMGGAELTLPVGSLPPGDYDQLVVVMTQIELVFLNGGKIALSPPGGGWTSIVRVTPFTVVQGETLTVELNLKLRGAFRSFGDSFRFFPDFDGKHHDD